MNDEGLKQTTEELSEDQLWVLLLSLIYDIPVKEWNEFAFDLIYKDRFSSSHKVIEVIKDCSADLNEGVQVLTLMNTGKADGTDGTSTKDKYDQYKSGSEYTIMNKSNNSYINPTGTFVGSVDKNANGMVTSIIFRQIN